MKEKKIEGFTEAEAKAILKQFKKTAQPIKKSYKVGKKASLIGIISDTHIGNIAYDEGLMDLAAKTFNDRKVDLVIHAGDVCDGLYLSRPEHVYELQYIGADAQVDKAVQELNKIKSPIFFITGNHSQKTFFKYAGYDIGKSIEERVKHSHNLGAETGEIMIGDALVKIMHPDEGTSYAISYKSQKMADSFEGGKKPKVCIIGHFHKAEYIFYRNIHIIQAGCLESQTPFMVSHSLAAHKGFWLVELIQGRNGIDRITPEFYPAYD